MLQICTVIMKRLASHRARKTLSKGDLPRLLVLLGFRVKSGSSGEKKQDEKVELCGGQVREKGEKKERWPWR